MDNLGTINPQEGNPAKELEEGYMGQIKSPMDKKPLDSLSSYLCGLREEAVRYRMTSGIEDTWINAEEAYLGIDDTNRGEYLGPRWVKPTTMSGPVTTYDRPRQPANIESTVFVPVSRRYVDAGSSKICEIILPIDDKAFSLSATPVPEIIAQKVNKEVVRDQLTGEPLKRDMTQQEIMQMQQAGQLKPGETPAPKELTYADLAEEQIALADEGAKAAEKRIYDWMVESRYPAEVRKVIFDSARIGVGVLKGPFPETRKKFAVVDGQIQILNEVKPAVKWVDPWNIYPDESCSEDIQSGSYVFEVDFLTRRQVIDLKKNPAYIREQVQACLDEGPISTRIVDRQEIADMKRKLTEDKRFETWYFYGVLTREEMTQCGEVIGIDTIPEGEEYIHAFVTLINDRVVRMTINPMSKSGRFPYKTIPWRRRAGLWGGIGVAEQIQVAQRMINAATRRMMVNAAKTSGAQVVLDRSCVIPADGQWTITPDKLWYKNNDSSTDDVRKAFNVFEFPNAQQELMGIIEYGFRLAEESCSIPLISQGQSGKTTPETLGGQQLQDNNANQLLRNIGYAFDDYMTEPMVQDFYEWLLLDPDIPSEEKKDWNINAHGSASLIEKAIQNQTIGQVLQGALNPAFGADPYKTFTQFLRSFRLDPRDFQMGKEEHEKSLQSQTQPPPQVLAAQVTAESAAKVAEMRAATERERIAKDTDRDTAFVQAEAERTMVDRAFRMEELKIRKEIEVMKYANQRQISLEDAKVQMAKATMSEETKRLLGAAELEFASTKAVGDRTHQKTLNDDKLASSNPPSLVRDEIGTAP